MFQKLRITLCRDDGHALKPGESGCRAEALTISRADSGALGLRLLARLAPEKPLFKTQHGFSRQEAVKVHLPAAQTRYLAVYQHKDWWIRPAFAGGAAQIPSRTQLLLWLDGGEYHVLTAVCGADYRADLRGEGEELLLTLSSNQDGMMACDTPALAYAHHADPFAACEAAVLLSLEMAGAGMPRSRKRYPPEFEKLGWCTWDAFYHQVDAQGIYKKLEEFREKQLPVSWVLIDDGWSVADYEQQELLGLDAVPEKFPAGLSGTIARIKEIYGVRWVGVWQALMGYWNGVGQSSPAYEAFRDSLAVLPDGRAVPDPKRSFAFWHTWHGYLARQGIDFVKIDQQSAPALFFGGLHTYGEASREMHAGVGASAALHFDGSAIHCMGMAPEELWARPSAAVIRSSDDFVPGAPGGFLEHCRQNVYGALLYGPLYWGDFDMFWSAHEKGVQHAMLRAVSGGPVYVSDKLGQTDAGVLWPLISRDGTLYRCDGVGLPTTDCLFMDPGQDAKPLKIWNTYGESFLVAAFAVTEEGPAAHGEIRLSDIPQAAGETYVCVSCRDGWARVLRGGESIPFQLPGGQSALFLLIPMHEKCTVIGLMEKYVSCAAVKQVFYESRECRIALKENGRLGFFLRETPRRALAGEGELALTALGGGLWTVDAPGEMVTIQW